MSDSDGGESNISEIDVEQSNWGKAKYDYYYNDYIDKDYPKITAKEERLAELEQEEALRIQKKLLSNIDNVDLDLAFDQDQEENLIDIIENQNKSIDSFIEAAATNKRKRVQFQDNDDSEGESNGSGEDDHDEEAQKRRPINMAIRKNRGLTPYKKKEYRNPRVKHKLKYKKAMSKRRRNVKEAKIEYHRYSGESTGIKTSTIKSIKLC